MSYINDIGTKYLRQIIGNSTVVHCGCLSIFFLKENPCQSSLPQLTILPHPYDIYYNEHVLHRIGRNYFVQHTEMRYNVLIVKWKVIYLFLNLKNILEKGHFVQLIPPGNK